MEEKIYEAKFFEEKYISEEPDLSLYNADTQEFINLSIEYAKKSKSDIVIIKDNDNISSIIHITVGMFFGGFKTAFLKFATKSTDFLIMSMNNDSNFDLKVIATYSLICEDRDL